MPAKDPNYNRDRQRRLRMERRKLLLGSQVCSRCGFDDPRALEFHHRDPTEKLFSVTSRLHIGMTALQAEVAKCDLICANCHAIEHDQGGVV